jgi:hypothetical protein
VHDGDRRGGEAEARVEGGDGRVVPAGDLPEVDGREDGAGQAQPGACGEVQVVGNALSADGVGYLGDGASFGGCQLPAFMGTSEAPKSTCRALIAAMPALLPTGE